MARKPEPTPAFFDHYSPFTKALENYTYKAGMLLIAAETMLEIAQESMPDMPPALTNRLKQAIAEYKEAAHSNT
jgi:hypothetical protein